MATVPRRTKKTRGGLGCEKATQISCSHDMRRDPGFYAGRVNDNWSPMPDDVIEQGGRRFPALNWRPSRGAVILGAAGLVAGLVAGYATGAHQAGHVSPSSSVTRGQRAACSPGPPEGGAPPQVTTVTTIGQAYDCVFAHYYAGPGLDDRVLLAAAFAGFTQELDRLGMDRPDATMPALTGNRATDWTAFAAVYEKVTGQLPASPAQRQDLAAATMTAMIASLHDNHARWSYPSPAAADGPGGPLGIMTSTAQPLADAAPQEALPPLFITAVPPGSPAASQGLRPGDVIVSVDGVPPFAGGTISQWVMNQLGGTGAPPPGPVTVGLQRPATGRTWTVALTPAPYPAQGSPPLPSAKLLNGNIADVQLTGFASGSAELVLQAVQRLAGRARLQGLILDLRGNGGGDPAEVSLLLGAFTHRAAYAYDCDVHGNCSATYTGTTVPLLHLPLVVLTDRNCASGCEAFSGAVKDLRLGTLVGTRTAGIVAGPAQGYRLGDGSLLALPAKHELGAHHELINGIGVAPDYNLPLTAQDLSNGHDPDISKALTLLGG